MPRNKDTVQNGRDDVDNVAAHEADVKLLEELSILQEQIQNKNEKIESCREKYSKY